MINTFSKLDSDTGDYSAHLRTAYLTIRGAGGVEAGSCMFT